MEQVSIFNLLFSIIPRSFVAIYFCQSLLFIKFSRKNLIFISLYFAATMWLARAYLPMGVHSFAAMLFLTAIISYKGHIRFNTTFPVTIVYFTLLYIFDIFVLYIYNMFTNLSLQDVWSLEVTRVLLTFPGSLAFIFISLYVKRNYYKVNGVF